MTASSSDSASSSSTSSSPVVSSLSIDDVSGLHSGNYTCAPSNARAAAIVVHVVDGEGPVMSCDVDGKGPFEAAIKAADGGDKVLVQAAESTRQGTQAGSQARRPPI